MGDSMPPAKSDISENRVLGSLTRSDLERLRPRLAEVALPVRTTLESPGKPISHVYFLGTGFVSLVLPLDDGSSVEAGLIGAEGFVGVHAALGADSSPSEAMVQMSGRGWRMPLEVFRLELERNRTFRRSALLFAQALSVQISYSVACNARHRVDQRLARWLSAARDRTGSNGLPISQEFLSMMLGCRRASVTEAIARFRKARLIEGATGMISVADPRGLRTAACSCYGAVRNEYQRLFR